MVQFIKIVQLSVFALVFSLVTASKSDAVTARIRTNDWKLQQASVYGVIYWSDYNRAYGTNYYTVTLGL